MSRTNVRTMNVMESTGAPLRYFDPATGVEIFFGWLEDEEHPPDPVDLEWDAYMEEAGEFVDVSERFEVLEGSVESGQLIFHFRTFKDKMSMQGGLLVIVPTNLSIVPSMDHKGEGTIQSPRKDFPEEDLIAYWYVGPSGFKSLIFSVGNKTMLGSATTSAGDVPWNWHYGFEIQGSIPVI